MIFKKKPRQKNLFFYIHNLMQLLSSNNTKIKKGEKMGWLTLGLSLAPHTLSGKNFCAHASVGCAAACLFTSGHGRFDKVKNARIARSRFFIEDRAAFLSQLKEEIKKGMKRANKLGMNLAIRLNVVSDLPWENLINMEGEFPSVQFYDYTPNPKRMINFLNKSNNFPFNYHLTFSRKENNQSVCELIAQMGGNVAVVFDTLPASYLNKIVVDGDETDLRFLDKHNSIVGLKAKGDGKKDNSGFVVKI